MRCVVYDDILSLGGEKQYFYKMGQDIFSVSLAAIYTTNINKAFVFTNKRQARAFIKEYGGKIQTIEEV